MVFVIMVLGTENSASYLKLSKTNNICLNDSNSYIKKRLNLKLEPVLEDMTETRTSVMYKYIIQEKAKIPKNIVLKIYKNSMGADVPDNPAQNDFRHLEYLYSIAPKIPNLLIPKPLMLLSEINGIIVEWMMNCQSVDDLMSMGQRNSSHNSFFELEDCFMKIGNTLGAIQSATINLEVNKAKFYFVRKFDEIKKKKHYLYKIKAANQALSYIENNLPAIDWQELKIVWTHGDFDHSNILFTNTKKLVLLDFTESRFDSLYNDIARFIVRTHSNYGSNYLKYASNDLTKLNSVFLLEYIKKFNSNKFSKFIYNFFILFNILQSFSNSLSLNSIQRNYHLLALLNNCMKKIGDKNCNREPYSLL